MSKVSIFQIFYNSEVKRTLDPGFIPLENNNLRADWREYWPIRDFLISNELDDEKLYGFFSPKFKSKTGLSAQECYSFIDNSDGEVDVFSFSPFFDICTWYQNSFIQLIDMEPNCRNAILESIKLIDKSIVVDEMVMHSGNNIFCNYFVAKPKFWREWFRICELIFQEVEFANSPLSMELQAPAGNHHSNAPIKTFVIERVASLMLATNNKWISKAYSPFLLPLAPTRIVEDGAALIQMDALKIAYAESGRNEYLNLYKNIHQLVSRNLYGH